MGLDGYKLTGKAREDFLKKSQKIAAEKMEMHELYKFYYDYIEHGGRPAEEGYNFKENFLKLINYINRKIESLKNEGELSEFVEIRARVKGLASAIRNHNKERSTFENNITKKLKDTEEELEKGKTLDDIFGIEIVGATEEEINYLREVLENFLSKTRPTKKHNKENGYKAEHDSYYLKNEITGEDYQIIEPDKTPIIECQYKLIATIRNCQYGEKASHLTYKGEKTEDIQQMYDEGEFIIGYNLPTMYKSDYDKNGNPIMRKLSVEETLREEYPFLNMSQKNKARDE